MEGKIRRMERQEENKRKRKDEKEGAKGFMAASS
jgi:hypothetical protein